MSLVRSRFGLVGLGLLALAGTAFGAETAQPDPAKIRIERRGYQGAVNFISARNAGDTIPVDVPKGRERLAAVAFLDQYGPLMGITDPMSELTVQKIESDQLGHLHTSYQQVFKGVEVYSGIVRVHQRADGIYSANGRFYPIKASMGVVPTLDADAGALAAKKAAWEAPGAALEEQRLVIVDPGWYGDPIAGAHLAWYVVLNDGDAFREAMFVDAHTGEVLDRWSLIEAALNRSILDGAGTNTVPAAPARAEGGAAVADAEVNRAYDYAGDYYRFLQRGFGRDSINNAGLQLICLVNTTTLSCPNANWNGVRTNFCTGIVTDEVIGHEFTHGLTGYTAGLIYQNQSGQLNESFSDVMGETLDLLNGNVSAIGAPGGIAWPLPPAVGPGLDTPNNARTGACSTRPAFVDGVRWLIGEDALGFSNAIRDMWNPTCRNHPDSANSLLQTCSATDSGGVHSGSGVNNHAFALAVDGGTFNGRTVGSVGLIKACAIWYRALTVYLTPASDFKDAYDAINQAATDLIGIAPNDPRTGAPFTSTITAADKNNVNEALLAVELNTDGRCGQTSNVLDDTTVPLECPNATVLFSDDFEASTLGWAVSNSAPPTPYDWVVRGTLPFERTGRAAWCEDRAVGNCNTVNESGTHSMNSQTITIPASATRPYLAFTHTIGSEGAFDGGRVEIAINSPVYNPVPRTAIEFNPYNNKLRSAALGNTSPLAGEDTWSGVGGRWGRTIIDLSGLGVTGQDIRIRFTFSKDGCTGSTGWYVDDLVVYNCPDCDNNTVADVRQFRYRASTPAAGPIGTAMNQTLTLTGVPDAAGDATIEFLTNADLAAANEFFDVQVNGSAVGQAFVVGGVDCPTTSLRGSLIVPAATWNAAVNLSPDGATANITIIPSAEVNGAACNGSFVGLNVRFNLAPSDANSNFILDSCEVAPCPADFNGIGGVTVQDIFDFLAAYFAGSAAADFNHVGGVTVQDIFDYLAAYFAGCP